MKRTEKNRLLRRIKLRPPQPWWKAKRVRTSVATQENAPVYMIHLRTNTSRTPMRRREMMVAAVQLQVIFVLQSTLGKVTPLPLGNTQGRYVGHDTSGVPILKEDFGDFVPVYDLTGKALASTILNSLRSHGFDLNLLCGQGYDGAASMSGHLNGVQAFIRQTASKALYVHISAHSLNLALLHA
ncbi:hypothetical protein HPB51_003894 [Rhipicephalus microplus]|uniref:DUF4371 domain-containing protein n=1 Tax=Rhipicephalus microplus TaxID=6941 RepID=A0A9J6EF80_RHIMP|nr:hypothetical protein HPB51_003894 [Rhipicephalus microplus]